MAKQMKSIKLTPAQVKSWDCEKVRDYLERTSGLVYVSILVPATIVKKFSDSGEDIEKTAVKLLEGYAKVKLKGDSNE